MARNRLQSDGLQDIPLQPESESLLASDARAAATDAALSEHQGLRMRIANIEANISNIENLFARHLSSSWSKATGNEIDRLSAETKILIQNSRNNLKALIQATGYMESGKIVTMRRQEERYLARQLSDVAAKYNKVLLYIQQQTKSRLERQYLIVKPNATPDQIQAVVESGSPVFENELLVGHMAQQSAALREVKDRHAEILKLAQAIAELAALQDDFKEMLNSQQKQIDVIEDHVEVTIDNIASGTRELHKAADNKLSENKSKRIMFAVIGAIILAIILYFVITHVKIGSTPSTPTPTSAPK
ncbi:t-SNARE [Polychytrium aggregatum]|uniref:t-SNARE n=1 Tax=Polychytrium aggregatum TaxID=110093 RepID=UPI0022FE479F|nr:t-SNARE [Polychytrium aggregatum]KAI9207993.1 t-SNARE [Polychytrium aggregatum]